MNSLTKKFVSCVVFVFGMGLMGCSLKQVDRSYVNDPLMQVTAGGDVSEISPLTGLKNREKSSGGGSCSVCAH